MREQAPQDFAIAAIVRAELTFGAHKSQRAEENLKLLEAFMAPLRSVAFADKAAVEYGALRSELEQRGSVIGPNDLILAATVLAADGTLVTNNLKEFKRCPTTLSYGKVSNSSSKKKS